MPRRKSPPPAAPGPARLEPLTALTAPARAEFERIVAKLTAAGTIGGTDMGTITIYAATWGRWTEAQGQITKAGSVCKSPSGYPLINPYVTIANAAAKQLNLLARQLGLVAPARNRSRKKPKTRPQSISQLLGEKSQ